MQHDSRRQALLRSSYALALALAFFGALSCGGDSPTDPQDGTDDVGEPESLVVTPDSLAFSAFGDSTQLAAVARDAAGNEVADVPVLWASLDPTVATVRQSGWVVATRNGTAGVVASAGGAADTVEVAVAQIAAALALSPDQVTLGQGDTLRLSAVVTDSNGVDIEAPAIEWSSAAAGVATVDTAGLVTALRGGTAVVTASTVGLSDEATVAVQDLIAFQTDRAGKSEIYVMNADGSAQVNLTNHPGGDFRPVWSPDGSRVAFTSDRDGNQEIYVMNADGSGQTNLTRSSIDLEGDAAWSPDGTTIAFVRRTFGFDVWLMNADGGDARNLMADDLTAAQALGPAWSPDGTTIAFVSNRDHNREVYVMRADGEAQTNLTNDSGFDGGPVWSPDGTMIAFVTSRDGDQEIYVMAADGSGPINLTRNGFGDAREPAWRPRR